MRPVHRLAFVALLCVAIGCASSGDKDRLNPNQSASSADESHPLYAFNLMRDGSILLQQERYEDALKKFTMADEAQPGNATVHNLIGLCHLRLQRPEVAIKSFDQAMALLPNFTDARNNRGIAYLSLGQLSLAEVDFLAVLNDTTYAHHWAVYHNLGLTYRQKGQIGAAEENFRRAITAPTPVLESYLQLADLAQAAGKNESAISLLEEADLKFPDRFEAALALGRLLVTLRRPDDARQYLDKVVRADPNSEAADEARSLLGEL